MGLFDNLFKKKESQKELDDKFLEKFEEYEEEMQKQEEEDEEDSIGAAPLCQPEVEEQPEEVEVTEEETTEDEPVQEEKGFFSKLVKGLSKTKNNIVGSVDNLLKGFTKIDEELFEELEETLIMADLGVNTTMQIIEDMRESVKSKNITDPMEIKNLLKEELSELLIPKEQRTENREQLSKQKVIFVIGVNGVGKTTSIGKLAAKYKEQGNKVLLAAADTFRAAAIDQLEEWANRSGVDMVKHSEGADPGAVVYDAAQAAKARNVDLLICDTAGRLHNKKNLMDELKKMHKIIDREFPDAEKEMLLVLDATTGQNALQQAKLFGEIINIDGLVLTKLDGTAKGGIVIAIQKELNIPVRYIGVGEGINDLQEFNAQDFVNALFE